MKQSKALARLNLATVNASVAKGTYQGVARAALLMAAAPTRSGPNGGGSWILRYQRAGKATESRWVLGRLALRRGAPCGPRWRRKRPPSSTAPPARRPPGR